MGACDLEQYAFNSVKPGDYGMNQFRDYGVNRNYGCNSPNTYQLNSCGANYGR